MARRAGVKNTVRRPSAPGIAAALLLAPSLASAGSFAVMTYNVRGLPPPLIEDRHTEIAEIAPRLEDFHTAGGSHAGIDSVVGLQEVFAADYYATLTDAQTITYPYFTAKDDGGPANLGDGLTILSDYALQDFSRTQWNDCHGTLGSDGSDCDTDKGFSYARVVLEPNVSFDLYTLHADAGQDTASKTARRANILQLMSTIDALSPEGTAVVVLGDTNSLYTRADDNVESLVTGAGLNDVWVQLEHAGIVPGKGADIDSGCAADPGGSNCELVDKVLYRDGSQLVLAPQSYAALKTMFSDGEGELSDHTPIAVTFDYALVTTTTTTTSSSSTSTSTSTSTTIPSDRPCGDPVAFVAKRVAKRAAVTGDSRAVVASDALFVLRAAVGSSECSLCTCDVDDNGKVSASDALRVLKKAVGQNITLVCPACS